MDCGREARISLKSAQPRIGATFNCLVPGFDLCRLGRHLRQPGLLPPPRGHRPPALPRDGRPAVLAGSRLWAPRQQELSIAGLCQETRSGRTWDTSSWSGGTFLHALFRLQIACRSWPQSICINNYPYIRVLRQGGWCRGPRPPRGACAGPAETEGKRRGIKGRPARTAAAAGITLPGLYSNFEINCFTHTSPPTWIGSIIIPSASRAGLGRNLANC